MLNFKSITLAALVALSSRSLAQGSSSSTNSSSYLYDAALVDWDGDGMVGGLYRPINTSSPKAGIAVFVMHAEQDYINFVACSELQSRGYTVLCANNEASKWGDMTDLDFEPMILNIGAGVSFLRGLSYVDKVVLLVSRLILTRNLLA